MTKNSEVKHRSVPRADDDNKELRSVPILSQRRFYNKLHSVHNSSNFVEAPAEMNNFSLLEPIRM